MSKGVGTHNDLHSEQGARRGEHSGRSRNPVIRVADIGWLEFEKPNLARAEAFARAFGFGTVVRTPDEVQLRGTDPGAPCVILRRGARSRFVGIAFKAQDDVDVLRLADAAGATVRALPESIGGMSVDLADQSGIPVQVVAGTHALPELPGQDAHVFNFASPAANQRHAAPEPGAGQSAATWARRRSDHQVHRGAELVPRQPRNDCQRFPLLPRPA